jgi:spore germination cell wall hydrolase CwlJ-like protein
MIRIIDGEVLAWAGAAALIASVTVFRPLPVGGQAADPEPDAAKKQQETAECVTYAAERQQIEETQVRCTNIESAWVEPISYDYSASDAYLLAKIAYGEAGGEDVEGQALVIRVVLNRVWSDDFPDSIPEVIYQTDTGIQFAATTAADWDSWEPSESCWQALELVESGWDESQGATYFCAGGESPWHQEYLTELFTHGGHVFYK